MEFAMTIVFNDDDLINAYKQKQRIWYTYLAVLAVFLVICIANIVYYVSLPYEDPMQPLLFGSYALQAAPLLSFPISF